MLQKAYIRHDKEAFKKDAGLGMLVFRLSLINGRLLSSSGELFILVRSDYCFNSDIIKITRK